MNVGGTFTTALIRSLYVAIGTGLAASLPVYATTSEFKPISVAFLGAFLAAIGIRGVVEGKVDSARQRDGNVTPADVQPAGSGKP